MKSKRQAGAMIPGALAAAASAALFCAIFVFGLGGAPACAQSASVPAINPDPASAPKAGRPALPSDTLTTPLPDKLGCFHLVHDSWEEVPCATKEEMKNLRRPKPADGITSTYHTILDWTGQTTSFRTPIVWGEVAVNLDNPDQSTENDVLGTATPTPNSFSIQNNTNTFVSPFSKDGYPFSSVPGCTNSASKPGDWGWVQFTWMQSGSGAGASGSFCIWNVDTTISGTDQGPKCNDNFVGYMSICLTPPITDKYTLKPLTGNGSTSDVAQMIGYTYCPNSGSNAGCTLYALAYLPWVEGDAGWWLLHAPDYMGLAANWYQVQGTIYGYGNGSVATFTNATVYTYVGVSACETSPQPTHPSVFEQDCTPINGEDLHMTAEPYEYPLTEEGSNLVSGSPTYFGCAYYGCGMTYTATTE
jgi:hypothetical protein